MVMLLTILTVAFMMRAGSEKQSSGYYHAEATTRELSDTTLNLVEGEINEATTQGTSYAWASQPGAIRVYDNTGAAYKIFKLYSSNALSWSATGNSGTSVQQFFSTYDNPSASATPWYQLPGQWVDLNAPVNSDPNPSATTGLGSPNFTHFPILDPRDPANSPPTTTVTTKMDGFSITSPPVDTTKIDSNGLPNPAPMPVQWLYVLQNGTLTAPASAPDASGNYTFSVAPSTTNPIVGRIAFWTDDETCKVNINTAAGDGLNSTTSPYPINVASGPADGTKAGMFWSTPYFYSNDDINLAIYQPFQGEFQRYPGHPGTVSFNNILNSLGNTLAGSTFYNNPNPSAGTPTVGITPRYTYNPPVNQAALTVNVNTPVLALSNSRLYPTVAEMLFQPSRTQSVVNPGTPSAKTRQQEESARFFLSAHSRAPELNLYGLPRVAIWPISYPSYAPTSGPAPGVAPPTSTSASAVDKLIAFDSSVSTNPYYFSRVSAGGSAGGSAWYYPNNATGCQSATTDINIPRNVQLLSYLDYLTQTQVPGYGTGLGTTTPGTGGALGGSGSVSKYGSWGMREILTEIFDYIRITNLMDSHFVTLTQTSPSWVDYRVGLNPYVWPYYTTPTPYGSPWEQPGGYAYGWNQIVPSTYSTWSTTGVGTLPVLQEVTIHFVALGDDANPIPAREWKGGQPITGNGSVDGNGNPRGAGDIGILNLPVPYDKTNITTDNSVDGSGNPTATNGQGDVAPGRVAIQAFIYTQWLFPAASHSPQNPALSMEISGLNNLDISSAPSPSGNPTVTPLTSFAMGPYATPISASTVLQFCSEPGLPPDPTKSPPFAGLPAIVNFGRDNERMDWAASQGPLGIGQNFGYYPSYGLTGSQTSNRLLAPSSKGPAGNGFSINGGGGPVGCPVTYNFPFYSSIFTISKTESPPHLALTAAAPITVKLYNGSYLGPYSGGSWSGGAPPIGDSNLYATYQIQFPAGPSATMKVPVVDPNGYRIIGTQQARQGFQPDSNPQDTTNYYIPGPSSDERWWITQQVDQTAFIDFNYTTDSSGNRTYFDVAQSMILSAPWSDARMLMSGGLNNILPTTAFTAHPSWGSSNYAHDLISTGSYSYWNGTSTQLVAGVPPQPQNSNLDSNWRSAGTGYSVAPYSSASISSALTNKGAPGDWDNGVGGWGDGPWINKADEGSLPATITGYTNYYPYFTGGNGTDSNYQSLFSPNKQIPSPGMFGSLPTGVPDVDATATTIIQPQPWQTLLFRPGSGAAGLTHHPGEAGYQRDGTALPGAPPDHTVLDLFWMPVAEPYAISEPFSTAGKINLNYQIVPFTYIKRATALRAALASEMIARCPASDGFYYKKQTGLGLNYPVNAAYTGRLTINLDQTTSQFDTKFAPPSGSWDLFHSASQICDTFLVPNGTATPQSSSAGSPYTLANFPSIWYDLSSKGDFALVGDNVRERPYANLYQKVTTKSNTYTVYYRVQSLKEPATLMTAGKWNESLGAITGEYRGSSTIERFIDVNEGTYNSSGVFTSTIPDAASQAAAGTTPTSLESYYKWRVVENRQFAP